LTAFVLARRKIRSWKIVTFYILGTSTVPIQLFIFPLYFGFAKLGLINNPLAVAFVYTAMFSPFAIMLLRTYFLAVPRELEEAAIIDGASPWQVFTMIFLPIVSPGVITVALIIGLYSWNEFLIALTFLQNREQLTAVVSFFLLSGQYTSDWGEIMAAALIIVLPIVILFVALQRRFIEGMAGGSVKG
jgi:raffinose/stachyose/melibiose transport system permease protein